MNAPSRLVLGARGEPSLLGGGELLGDRGQLTEPGPVGHARPGRSWLSPLRKPLAAPRRPIAGPHRAGDGRDAAPAAAGGAQFRRPHLCGHPGAADIGVAALGRGSHRPKTVVAAAPHTPWWPEPSVRADDRRLPLLLYVDSSGSGRANQGWKDSGDSVRFADGRIAEPPIALCEVQGYAYEAVRSGADLLEAFGRRGTDRYRAWADVLRSRFRDQFWVDDADGGHPPIALDGAKVRVDSLTSNVGHLLGTGLLDDAETARVVELLTSARMDSGYGLRTMSSAAGGYSPLNYHCGSVWPHDTAVVVMAMARSGHATEAAHLVEGLLSAGAAFAGRMPELFSGERRGHLLRPVPLPGRLPTAGLVRRRVRCPARGHARPASRRPGRRAADRAGTAEPRRPAAGRRAPDRRRVGHRRGRGHRGRARGQRYQAAGRGRLEVSRSVLRPRRGEVDG